MNTLEEVLGRVGARGNGFGKTPWKSTPRTFGGAAQPGFAEDWLAKRNHWQWQTLQYILAARGQAIALAAEDAGQGDCEALAPFYLVEEFARYKSRSAIEHHARQVLPSTLLALCEKADCRYDSLALCFALYHHDPEQLSHVLCLEKVYRCGFARMRLLQNVRRPAQSFAEFLVPETVTGILRSLDEDQPPSQRSELRAILADDGRHRVFIRRPQRPGKLLERRGIRHGYRPEWIILEFLEGGRRVHIASRSVRKPLEIADRIATLYYGVECQYENENRVTYAAQLRRFLRWLQAGGDWELHLVELAVTSSPLDGSPQMRISDPQARPIGQAIAHFEAAIGPLLDDVERVQSVKVLFRGKRVTLVLENLGEGEDEFVVRYSDHRLEPPDRKALEDYLEQTHGIAALSTEKRYKDAA